MPALPRAPATTVIALATSVAAVVAVIWLLGTLAPIAVPLLIAVFTASVMRPVQLALQRVLPSALGGLGTVIAAFLPVTLLLLAVVGFVLLGHAISPSADELRGMADDAVTWVQTHAHDAGLPVPELSEHVEALAGSAGTTLSALLYAGSGGIIATFATLLFLGEADALKGRVAKHLPRPTAVKIVEAFETVGLKVRQFLLMRTVAGAISATLATALLLGLNVRYALLWAAIGFVLNFIPNLGSLIAAGPPIVVATVQHGPLRGLGVMVGLFLFEQVVGNYIDPKLQGKKLRMSPPVVLLSVLFFTWLWGIPGTLIAVPCLVLITVIMEQVPMLAPFAGLLRHDANSEPLVDDVDVDASDVTVPPSEESTA